MPNVKKTLPKFRKPLRKVKNKPRQVYLVVSYGVDEPQIFFDHIPAADPAQAERICQRLRDNVTFVDHVLTAADLQAMAKRLAGETVASASDYFRKNFNKELMAMT